MVAKFPSRGVQVCARGIIARARVLRCAMKAVMKIAAHADERACAGSYSECEHAAFIGELTVIQGRETTS